jgi:hypothetical protein
MNGDQKGCGRKVPWPLSLTDVVYVSVWSRIEPFSARHDIDAHSCPVSGLQCFIVDCETFQSCSHVWLIFSRLRKFSR